MMNLSQDISKKVAFVTGASRGIGKATVLQLASEGVHVGLIARNEERLDETAKKAADFGVNTASASADLADLKETVQAVDYLTAKLGSPDILINNAAISTKGSFLDIEPDEWKRVLEVNVFGTYHMTRAVLPKMIEKSNGDIITISSSNGLKGTAGSTSYSASKFAVQGMTEALMQEVRKNNIRVSTLNPSLVATELSMGDKLEEADKEKFMQPEDIAEYMVSLLKLHPRIFIKTSLQWATNPF
ncbi:3-ketoacyl-ACP reductase [Halobacillus salinarum]|uniref:3-ketoacyl-ACP reductase n=1 Tax=Halobacillus salinarum TaxID=2932257 RepID=A0ABY4EKP6_9BACI|nr:3-ketoacyl-ACP reductase [Halobacillus salinarum]UOQ42641.1 3-ketoacyl-ACP reductase [Halobacillus salinarum]